MIDGKADSMGLGPVATVSLAKARAKAEQVRDLPCLADHMHKRILLSAR
jgi:hypothetical protein